MPWWTQYALTYIGVMILFSLAHILDARVNRRRMAQSCKHEDMVPVYVCTGEHVTDLCTACYRVEYQVKWIYKGE